MILRRDDGKLWKIGAPVRTPDGHLLATGTLLDEDYTPVLPGGRVTAPLVSPNRRWVVKAQRDGSYAVERQDGTDRCPWHHETKNLADWCAADQNRCDA